MGDDSPNDKVATFPCLSMVSSTSPFFHFGLGEIVKSGDEGQWWGSFPPCSKSVEGHVNARAITAASYRLRYGVSSASLILRFCSGRLGRNWLIFLMFKSLRLS